MIGEWGVGSGRDKGDMGDKGEESSKYEGNEKIKLLLLNSGVRTFFNSKLKTPDEELLISLLIAVRVVVVLFSAIR
ncbi:MAG TPA: hypothetical protein DD379_10715 [Cyanobacteria bacterium UBA11162]|nr:hypothetical protein [Cyanobacteria bacterium UBA11162]